VQVVSANVVSAGIYATQDDTAALWADPVVAATSDGQGVTAAQVEPVADTTTITVGIRAAHSVNVSEARVVQLMFIS